MRPSALPALAQCAKFKSGPAKSFALDGTIRHEALESKFRSQTNEIAPHLVPLLNDKDIEGIEWAFDYIQLHAPLRDHLLQIEQLKAVFDSKGSELMSGTLDYSCGPNLYDIKWRERNYREQMAAYALALMAELGVSLISVNLLFMESQQVTAYVLDVGEAESIVKATMARALDPFAVATPCDYCGWCANLKTCPPYIEAVEKARLVESLDPEPLTPGEFHDPNELARALIAAKLVKKWAAAIEEEAKQRALDGAVLPGFEVKSKAGKRYVDDIQEAYLRSGLEQEAFLAACSVSLTKLAAARRALDGTTHANSRKETLQRLGDIVEQADNVYYLTRSKES